MTTSRTLQARALRAQMTKAEIRLWRDLKLLRADGYHFRRQAPFEGFFLDFVCFSRRLVIEVDGSVHDDERQAEHDRVRTLMLERRGFRVIRFWNEQVLGNIDGVLDEIRSELASRRPTRPGASAGPPSP